MPETLTPLEKRVYHYMIDFLAENTYQPSIREIAKRFRIKSTKTVSDLLHALTAKGYIERDHSRSRGVRILGFASAGQVQPVPVLQEEGAAPPADERQRYVTMDRRFLPSEDAFFLRAADDAMTGRAVTAGDYLLVSPTVKAADGDMVAVRYGNTTLVRTLTHRGMTLVLESANPAVPAVEVGPGDDYQILGVVSCVFRPFHERLPVAEALVAEDTEESHAALAAVPEMPALPMASQVS